MKWFDRRYKEMVDMHGPGTLSVVCAISKRLRNHVKIGNIDRIAECLLSKLPI